MALPSLIADMQSMSIEMNKNRSNSQGMQLRIDPPFFPEYPPYDWRSELRWEDVQPYIERMIAQFAPYLSAGNVGGFEEARKFAFETEQALRDTSVDKHQYFARLEYYVNQRMPEILSAQGVRSDQYIAFEQIGGFGQPLAIYDEEERLWLRDEFQRLEHKIPVLELVIAYYRKRHIRPDIIERLEHIKNTIAVQILQMPRGIFYIDRATLVALKSKMQNCQRELYEQHHGGIDQTQADTNKVLDMLSHLTL